MTAASPGPGPNIFSILAAENEGLYRARRETFVLSLLGQAAVLGLLIYFTSCVIQHTPEIAKRIPNLNELPLIFSGRNGGGGGGGDPLPASHGNLPRASLDSQLAPPTVMLPKEMPKALKMALPAKAETSSAMLTAKPTPRAKACFCAAVLPFTAPR